MNPSLVEVCKSKGFAIQSLVYSANSTFVYRGLSSANSYPVAIKVLTNLNDRSYDCAYKECERHLKFANLPHVVTVYNSFGFSDGGLWSFAIVLEWIEKDLLKEIEHREKNAFPWTEDELMVIAKDLVDTLALLQESELAHRDIKPQNIFFDASRQVKIGDFGSSRTFETQIAQAMAITVTGTPFFMSPELKLLLMSRENTGFYNPFKSDVYSLGITLLHCYRLDPPTGLLSLQNLEESTIQLLATVTFPRFRQLLYYTLIVSPDDRPDFLQLRSYLSESHEPPQPPEILESSPPSCPHLTDSTQDYYRFDCHGFFCGACVEVESKDELPTISLEKLVCPICHRNTQYYLRPAQPSSDTAMKNLSTSTPVSARPSLQANIKSAPSIPLISSSKESIKPMHKRELATTDKEGIRAKPSIPKSIPRSSCIVPGSGEQSHRDLLASERHIQNDEHPDESKVNGDRSSQDMIENDRKLKKKPHAKTCWDYLLKCKYSREADS